MKDKNMCYCSYFFQCSVSFNEPPFPLKGRCRQLGKTCSLEDPALSDSFAHVLEGPSQEEYSRTRVCVSLLPGSSFYHVYDS